MNINSIYAYHFHEEQVRLGDWETSHVPSCGEQVHSRSKKLSLTVQRPNPTKLNRRCSSPFLWLPMESISRISSLLESGMYQQSCNLQMRQLEADRLTARELTLDAAQSARSSRTTTKTLPAGQIKKLLDSRNDRDVLEGLRKVISVRSPVCHEYSNSTRQAHNFHLRLAAHLRTILTCTVDVSITTMPTLFLLGRQERRVSQHRDQETCLYISP